MIPWLVLKSAVQTYGSDHTSLHRNQLTMRRRCSKLPPVIDVHLSLQRAMGNVGKPKRTTIQRPSNLDAV